MLKNITLCFIAVAFLLSALYLGMSKDLCNRDLSTAEYQSMKLDCNFWLYR